MDMDAVSVFFGFGRAENQRVPDLTPATQDGRRHTLKVPQNVWEEMIEGNLKVKLPTIWTDGKQRWEESEKRKEEKKIKEEKGSEERRCTRTGRKITKFGSRGSKSRLAKAAGAEPSWDMRDETLHAVVTRSAFRSQNSVKNCRFEARVHAKMLKTPHVRTTFGRSRHDNNNYSYNYDYNYNYSYHYH